MMWIWVLVGGLVLLTLIDCIFVMPRIPLFEEKYMTNRGDKPMPKVRNTERVRIHLTPSTAGTVIGRIEAGSEITILRTVNEMWYEISYNGKTGFIMNSSVLREIRSPAPKGGNSK